MQVNKEAGTRSLKDRLGRLLKRLREEDQMMDRGESVATADGSARPGLEVAARMEVRPGNPAVTPDGRLILSLHPFPYGEPSPYRVVEALEDGSIRPFPNEEWSTAPDGDGVGFSAVIGLQADHNGVVWMLDMGGEGLPPKVVAWDTRRDELHRVIYVPPHATRPNSFQQDLVVDLAHRAIFIADMTRGDLFGESDPAIVAIDLETGRVWRALEGHESLQPEDDAPLVIDGRPVRAVGPDRRPAEPRMGLNPIAIDPQSEWVYYGSVNGTSVYRVRAADLLDADLAPRELHGRVERYGEKAPSDGIGIDGAGNVYVTDLINNAIGVTGPDGGYRLLLKDDERLNWPDGMSYGPDGHFYVVVSQLHRAAAFNEGRDESRVPFEVVRFRALAPSAVGR